MNATSYIELGVKTIGELCKTHNVDLNDLRKAFPNRPTTKAELNAVALWVSKYITAAQATTKALAPPSTPSQVKPNWSGIANRKDNNGKAMPSYYAVEMDGVLKFYRVKRGRKAGVIFVDVQASDDHYPVQNYGSVIAILNVIAKDPKAAMERYGQEIGSCGHCHRTLTDATSRALGIGPVCAEGGY